MALAPSIGVVLAFRFLQGMGSAGIANVTVGAIRDRYAGRAVVDALARLALVTGSLPIIAPFLGAHLQELLGWRGLFWVIAAYGAFAAVTLVMGLSESLPRSARLPLHPRALAARISMLVRDRAFVGVALIGGLIVSGVFTLGSSSSLLLQGTFGLSPQTFSLVFAVNALTFVIGTQVSARAMRRVRPVRLLGTALIAATLAGTTVIVAGSLGLAALMTATALFQLCAGLAIPCLQVIWLTRQGAQAGTAGAVLGAVNFGLAGLTSPIVGAIGITSSLPMGAIMSGALALATLVYLTLVRSAGSEVPKVS